MENHKPLSPKTCPSSLTLLGGQKQADLSSFIKPNCEKPKQPVFNLNNVNVILQKLKSTSTGPDNLSPKLLKSARLELSHIIENQLGFPRSSVMGPLFFTIYKNDLPLMLRNLKNKLFADDTAVYKSGTNVELLIKFFIMNVKPLYRLVY